MVPYLNNHRRAGAWKITNRQKMQGFKEMTFMSLLQGGLFPAFFIAKLVFFRGE